ncbi:MAG TPA: hypothetical protein VND68_07640 [Chloroflexia bacterium]|nr:hypothetical protein [Chloroflexia bacterium]
MPTLIALYENVERATSTVENLRSISILPEDISVLQLASQASLEEVLISIDRGDVPGDLSGGLPGVRAVMLPNVGPVVVIGAESTTLAGSGLGTSGQGLVGLLSGLGVSAEVARVYETGLRKGWPLVIVHAPEEHIDLIKGTLLRSGTADLNQLEGYGSLVAPGLGGDVIIGPYYRDLGGVETYTGQIAVAQSTPGERVGIEHETTGADVAEQGGTGQAPVPGEVAGDIYGGYTSGAVGGVVGGVVGGPVGSVVGGLAGGGVSDEYDEAGAPMDGQDMAANSELQGEPGVGPY